MKYSFARTLCLVGVLLCFACASGPQTSKTDQLTVGKVQGEIRVGLDAASVAEILGSPNIVTTDAKRREVWIYDKISTSRVDQSSGVHGGLIIVGGGGKQSSRTTTQKTLTVIIKYDEEMKVRDFAYNFSQF